MNRPLGNSKGSLFSGILFFLAISMPGVLLAAEQAVVVVGGDHSNPPYEFIEDGRATGFNIDMIKAVAEVTGLHADIRLGPWNRVRRELEEGKIDVLAGMYSSSERSERVDFSVSHTLVTPGIFVRKDSPINSMGDLKGKEIIVQEADLIHDYLKRSNIPSRIVTVANPEEELLLLASGSHDCALMPSRLQGEFLIQKLNLENLKGINAELPQLRYCFAVKKGNSELKYRLDEGLNILRVSGRYRQIYEKWFGVYERNEIWDRIRNYVILAAGCVGLLFLGGIVWSRALRKEVMKRTSELRESEEKFRVLAETTPAGIIVHQGERIVYANPTAIHASGYTEQKLLEMKFWDLAPDDLKEVVKQRGLARQQGETVPGRFEFRWTDKSGEERWALLSGARIQFNGKPAGLATLIDITDRKRVEEELRLAHAQLEERVAERTAELAETVQALLLSRFCIDKAAVGIFQTTSDGSILSVNEFACQSLGYAVEELLKLKIFDIDPVISQEKMLEIKRMLEETGSATHESVHRRKDGTTFPVEITANNLEFEGKPYTFSFVKDITERKRSEEVLRESKVRLSMAMDLSKLVQWEYDVESGMFTFDDQFYGLYGTTAEREGGKQMSAADYALRFIPAEEREAVAGGIAEVLADSRNQLEHRIVKPDGEERYMLVRGEAVHDQMGRIIKIRGANQDITERKRMESELWDSKEKYRSIVDAFDGFIYICSEDCRIEFMNRKLIERTGCDATGKLCYEVIHDRDSVCSWCVNDKVFAGETLHWEMLSPKDGRWYYVVNVPIFNADGTTSKHSVITDIDNLKRKEEKLQQQKQQMEELNATLEKRVREEVAKNREKDVMLIQQNRQAAMGELLDHIAHQWKQPLNTISLLVQNLLEHSSTGIQKEIPLTVGKTTALVEHMAQTIEVFRDFYRPDKEMALFSINECIGLTLAFISPALKHDMIHVTLDLCPELWAVGYPKEYTQVLLNILSNSRNVFRERNIAAPELKIKSFPESGRAVVTISDNGGGIAESIIGRIFDLYVTTREASGGTGIGLYMSKGIIEKNMGGTLTAENSGEGARFTITLTMYRP